MKVTIYGQQTVYYAYEADYEDLLDLKEDGEEMPTQEELRKLASSNRMGWITQEMRESFADTAYEVDSSAMEWTEIQVSDE